MKTVVGEGGSAIVVPSDFSQLSVGLGRLPKQSADITTKIKNSSRFLKQRDQIFRRENPCQDDQAFNILTEALHTRQVPFTKLFRYATCVDYFLIALGVICSLLAAIFYVATIYSFGMFYQFFHNETSPPCLNIRNFDGTVRQFKYPYLWMCFLLIVCVFLKSLLFDLSAERQCKNMHLAYVESIMRKDAAWFDCYIDRDLPFRVRKDMQEIQIGMGETLAHLIFHTTVTILMMLASFVLNYEIALIASLVVPAFMITNILKVKAAMNFRKAEAKAYMPANKVAAYMLSKIQVIKTFCGEQHAVKAYESALYSVCATPAVRTTIFMTALWASLYWFISMVSHPVLMWLTIDYFDDYQEMMSKIQSCAECGDSLIWVCPHVPLYGRLDTILLYFTYAAYFLSNIPNVYSRLKRAQFVAAEVFFHIDWKSGIDNISKSGHIPRPRAIGKVVLTDVTFNYPVRPLDEILHTVNITVHPGQVVAIFGPSKCGKTTVLRLLLRKYDACEGTIQLDGADLHTLNVPWLRSQMGYISQYPEFLNLTIEQIISGSVEPNMQEVMRVCRKVNVLSDVVALPAGFKTMLGSKSKVKLNPVQIKKICLASVLMHKCRLILLDDFFCNMSELNETFFMELFESLRDNFTVIATSTKINALIKTCDIVYVMKKGEIVQFGNHDTMSTKKGFYMDLLQETLQEARLTVVSRPNTDSQLSYYKFADAIRQIHDLHDKDKHYDYSKLRGDKKAVTSVLLVFVFKLFANITHAVLESSFLDLRTKILPVSEIDGYPMIQTNLRIKAGVSERIILDHEVEEELHAGSSVGTNSTIDSTSSKFKLGAENVIDMLFDNFKRKNNRMNEKLQMNEEKIFRISEWKAAGLERLQHYFGWTVNSPVDTDSIRSEDSYLFWSEYTRRLQISNKSSRDPMTLFGFIKLARKGWAYFLLTSLASTTAGLCLVFSVIGTSQVLVVYREHKGTFVALREIPQVVYFACIAFVVIFIQEIVLPSGLCSQNKFRVAHFAAILEQEMGWFDNPRNEIEYLCEFLANDMFEVNITIIDWIVICGESSVILVSLIVVGVLYSGRLWKESLALLVIVPFLILINYMQTKYRILKTWKHPNAAESLLWDMISNKAVVIAQGLSGLILQLYIEYQFGTKPSLSRRLRRVWNLVKKHLIFALSRASFLLSFSLWTTVCHNEETFTHEEAMFFVIVTYLMLYGIHPMGYAYGLISTCSDHADSASFISETMKYRKMNEKINKNKRILVLERHMPPPSFMFKNVTCTDVVDGDVIVFRELNFCIDSGKYVAIVSQSVNTRIALMGLIFKLYDPVEGDIFINDISYNELQVKSLRKNIASITQDPDFFMELSIADNIAYGDITRVVPKQEITKAGKIAFIHDAIEEMPEKYDTKLKDLPINPETYALRQRMAIARAFVRKTKMVVVNEMTVSVDELSERLMMKALMNLRKGRTFIMITQRIYPIRGADTIVVLNENTVAEVGIDKDLLKMKGLYYEMYMSQQLYERGTEIVDIDAPSYTSHESYLIEDE